jgi:hypothetical protein
MYWNKLMKSFMAATLLGLCSFYVCSGAALDELNATVEFKAAQIDDTYGILLTSDELNNLKLKLIGEQVLDALANDPNASIESQIERALNIYQITDPVDSRQLLIEVEAYFARGSGRKPPCC